MNNLLKYLVIILVLVILAAGGFFVSRLVFKPEPIIIQKEINPTGILYLTLKPVEQGAIAIYAYDIKNNILGKSSGDYAMTTKFSSDEKLAFVEPDSKGNSQIFVAEKNKGKKQLTDSPTVSKRTPQWSPDNSLIAFQAKEPSENDRSDPDKWKIFLVDLLGNENFLTNGANPIFTPDGKIIVMKSDGLYLVSLNGGQQERIVKSSDEGKFDVAMKTAISNNGRYLALTSAGVNTIFLYKINSWNNPVQLDEIATIEAKAFWPIFSPDNNYLAVIETAITNNSNPRIVAYDLENFNGKVLQSLNGFNQSSMFMTDWR